MLHNPHLSWREIDATTIEVSAESAEGPARVRLIFEDGDIGRVEADDRPVRLDATSFRRDGKHTAATTAR